MKALYVRLRVMSDRHLTPTKVGGYSIVGGAAAGQLVGLVAAPILSRLYAPRDFGVYAVLSALLVTIGTVGASRLELAIPLPADEAQAQGLVAGGVCSALAVAVIGTAAVAVWGRRLSAAFGQPDLMPWLWIVPAAGALMSTYLILTQLAVRQRRFGAVGRRNLSQTAGMVLVQLAAGAAGLKSGGLVIGLGLSQGFGALSLARGAGLSSEEARQGRKPARVRAVVSRYRRFPMLLAPSGFCNVLGLQLPTILIAYWYGGQVAGWFGLTQRILALPVALVGTAVAQVYLGEFAKAVLGDFDRARCLFRRGTRTLVALAAGLLVVVFALGPLAFSVVLGSAWHQSGEYARALSLGLAGQMIGSPLSQTLIVLERQGLQFAWDVFRVVSITLAVGLAVAAGASALTAVWIIGALSALLYGVLWWLSYSSLRRVPAGPSSGEDDLDFGGISRAVAPNPVFDGRSGLE